MTKAQRALNDLEIVLDDVLDDKNEIISGWLETIAAALPRGYISHSYTIL